MSAFTDVWWDVWDRPIRGGLPLSASSGFLGTLGAIVRDHGSGAPLIFGCSHVMCPQGRGGAAVWQPVPCGQGGCLCNRVGIVGREFCTVVTSGGHRYFVDCAVARLDEDVPWEEGIAGMRIAGMARACRGMRVWKIGAGTGRTRGAVVDERHVETARLASANFLAPNQILIRPLPGNEGVSGSHRFSAIGDSGALVLDDEHRVVGLLWGASANGEAVACHIEPVVEALAIDIRGQR